MEGSITPQAMPQAEGRPTASEKSWYWLGEGRSSWLPGSPPSHLPWNTCRRAVGCFASREMGGRGCIFIHSLIHSSTKSHQFLLRALQRLGTKDPSLPPTKLVGQEG